ncbi:MAG TPA: nitroreductase family protein [Nevskiaceae bacterium]|nr:nitroreductase family protein [Nevskiaceae bacterium]
MEFFEVIKKRHSVRRFDSSKEVTEEQIEQILEAGQLAPSARNLQDWFFVVVKDPKFKTQMVDACSGQNFVGEASVIIIVCSDKRLADTHSTRHGPDFFTIQDTAIATQQIWLAITALGLGTCWIGAFDEEEVKRVLKLKDYLRPMAVLPIGYPVKKPSPISRRKLSEISKKI